MELGSSKASSRRVDVRPTICSTQDSSSSRAATSEPSSPPIPLTTTRRCCTNWKHTCLLVTAGRAAHVDGHVWCCRPIGLGICCHAGATPLDLVDVARSSAGSIVWFT